MKTITSEWFEFFPGDNPSFYAAHLNNPNADKFGLYDAGRLRFISFQTERRLSGDKANWFGIVVFEVVPDSLVQVYQRIFDRSEFGIVFLLGDALLRDDKGEWIEPVEDEAEVFVWERLADC